MARLGSPVLRLVVAALAATLVAAGLAVAGVSLPGHPHKTRTDASPSSNSGDVQSVIHGTPPSERGCDFGHAVATAARGSELPAGAQAACSRGHHHSDGDEASRARRSSTAAPSVDPSAGRQFGQETSG